MQREAQLSCQPHDSSRTSRVIGYSRRYRRRKYNNFWLFTTRDEFIDFFWRETFSKPSMKSKNSRTHELFCIEPSSLFKWKSLKMHMTGLEPSWKAKDKVIAKSNLTGEDFSHGMPASNCTFGGRHWQLGNSPRQKRSVFWLCDVCKTLLCAQQNRVNRFGRFHLEKFLLHMDFGGASCVYRLFHEILSGWGSTSFKEKREREKRKRISSRGREGGRESDIPSSEKVASAMGLAKDWDWRRRRRDVSFFCEGLWARKVGEVGWKKRRFVQAIAMLIPRENEIRDRKGEAQLKKCLW